jgi:hypothetical protein
MMPADKCAPDRQFTIVSGGQSGVDRAALDAAIRLEIPHRGWCPRGRVAEDGPLSSIYQLRETPSANYADRTLRNVLESDGTLILHCGPITGGTRLTDRLARKHKRPCKVLDLLMATDEESLGQVQRWLLTGQIKVLNVAGPRETHHPGIYERALVFLAELFALQQQKNGTNGF